MPARPIARRRALAAIAAVVILLLMGLPSIGRGPASAAPRMKSAPFLVAPAPPGPPAESVPLGQEAPAGPLRLRVLQVVVGPEAADLVAAASPTNEPTREGITYVLVNLRIRNAGTRPVHLDGNDFALTGASGVVRRFVGAQPPDPGLDGTLDPGATREGWVVLAAPVDERGLLLLFDSLTIPGNWADRVLALEEGAAIPDLSVPAAPNDTGTDPGAPAGLDTPIVTDDWEIELLEVVRGGAVYDLVDYRTGALGAEDAANETPWLALRLRVTNVRPGAEAAFLPPNAFTLADETGASLLDVTTLTPPRPDASGAYYPGASREGWVAFEIPGEAAYTVRFLPYATDPDPRYLTYE